MRLTFLNLLLVTVSCRLGVHLADALKNLGGTSVDQWKKQNLIISDIEISKEYNYPNEFNGKNNVHPNREPKSMYVPTGFGFQGGDYPAGGSFGIPQDAGTMSPGEDYQNIKASLAFVFELVPKMSEQLQNFKQTLPKILSAANNNKNYDFVEYYWVPFTSSEVGKYKKSNDPQEFEREVNKTYIEDKSESCLGEVFQGLQTAVDLVLPGSVIYVFTHSYQKKINYFKNLAVTILNKGIEVNFIELKGCYSYYYYLNQWQYDVLTVLGSGQIYVEEPYNIPKVHDYIAKELTELPVYFVTANGLATLNQDKFEVAVDKSVTEMIISVAGTKVTLIVEDPKGKYYVFTPAEMLLDASYTKIYQIKQPEYGMWKVYVKSGASYKLRINGLSDIRFHVKYAYYNANGIQLLDEPPFTSNNTLYVYTNPKIYLNKICTYNLMGKEIKCYALTPSTDDKRIYYAYNVNVPYEPYYLEVMGTDENQVKLQRLTSVAYRGSKPGQPIITLKDKIKVKKGEKVYIKCGIQSYVPILVSWYKNGKITNVYKECSKSCESDYIIPSVTADDLATYSCSAKNFFGSDYKTTQLYEESSADTRSPDYDNVIFNFGNLQDTTAQPTSIPTHPVSISITTRSTKKPYHQFLKSTTRRYYYDTEAPNFNLNYTVRCSLHNATNYNLTWERAMTTNDSGLLLPTEKEFHFKNNNLKYANLTHDVTKVLNCKSSGFGGKELLYVPTHEEVKRGKVKREAIEQAFIREFGDPNDVGDEPENLSETGLDSSGIHSPNDLIPPLRSLSKKK